MKNERKVQTYPELLIVLKSIDQLEKRHVVSNTEENTIQKYLTSTSSKHQPWWTKPSRTSWKWWKKWLWTWFVDRNVIFKKISKFSAHMHNFDISICCKSSFFLFTKYKSDISHFAPFSSLLFSRCVVPRCNTPLWLQPWLPRPHIFPPWQRGVFTSAPLCTPLWTGTRTHFCRCVLPLCPQTESTGPQRETQRGNKSEIVTYIVTF